MSVSLVDWDSHCTAELPGACTSKSNVHQRNSVRVDLNVFNGTGLARLCGDCSDNLFLNLLKTLRLRSNLFLSLLD